MFELPTVVVNRARSVGALEWIDELEGLVASLSHEWGFAIESVFDEGTEAFVAAVRRTDGTDAVLKILVPGPDGDVDAREAAMLELVAGDGCPTVLARDGASGALLLERLGPSMYALGIAYRERIPALCDTARRIWRRAPEAPFPNGAEKARSLAVAIVTMWEELGHPCPAAVIDHALTCAARREAAHDDERAVLVHGDIHQWNALTTHDRSGFKLVDPDGYLAEPELDVGVMLREDPLELRSMSDPMAAARWMARLLGVDATASWEWGVVERVSTGLLATKIDLQPAGREMLAVAEWLAGPARP